jgi:hypothetical protein
MVYPLFFSTLISPFVSVWPGKATHYAEALEKG